MDYRDVLIDGITQLNDWLDEALVPLSREQLNWLPEGKTVSAGFNAWHIIRTQDNITNFVFQRKQPVWVEQGYFEKFNLPKVDQGTGMDLAAARAITISDEALLRDYGATVARECMTFLENVSLETLDEPQMIRPLGEMPKWRVFRMVVMTHGFMHLGEINAIKGQLGLQFAL
jgi:DinB superfamily